MDGADQSSYIILAPTIHPSVIISIFNSAYIRLPLGDLSWGKAPNHYNLGKGINPKLFFGGELLVEIRTSAQAVPGLPVEHDVESRFMFLVVGTPTNFISFFFSVVLHLSHGSVK
uniref:Uncharacterized protein n=1 Tax=Odontella aurita TaxID=265563 RepID=A0A7S4HLP7_9STRA|mmetsp:Transcript_11906/g.34883  ORF Transcript_11906/g.34883 Transcript_11906/m.34883 type:complete len:115 (+) Transcript_11906:49-393(+)